MGSVIEHSVTSFYVEFRQDYVQVCLACTYRKSDKSKSSPYCEALILAILEHWTNDKLAKKKELHVYMTLPLWIEAMYGLFGRNCIVDSLDELVAENLIQREAYKGKHGGKMQYKYLLNITEVNKRLKATVTTNLCEEEQQLLVTVATVTSNLSSSSPTVTSNRKIESGKDIHNTYSERESEPVQQNRCSSSEPSLMLSDTEQCIDEWYCQMVATPPKVTVKLKQDYSLLAMHIKTFEQFQSLFECARAYIERKQLTNKRVQPGNLVFVLDDWLVEQNKTKPTAPIEEKPAEFIDKLLQGAAQVLVDSTHIEQRTAEMKRLYQVTEETAFRQAEKEARIEARDISEKELARLPHKGRLDYYVWFAYMLLGVQRQ